MPSVVTGVPPAPTTPLTVNLPMPVPAIWPFDFEEMTSPQSAFVVQALPVTWHAPALQVSGAETSDAFICVPAVAGTQAARMPTNTNSRTTGKGNTKRRMISSPSPAPPPADGLPDNGNARLRQEASAEGAQRKN